jgi:lysozyme
MATQLPSASLPWPIAWEGVKLIAEAEGCRLKAYRDVVGVWTLGWGETLGIREGMIWTQEMADQKLCERLTEFADDVNAALLNPATASELAALTSLAYNIGIHAFRRSSVLKYHNLCDPERAARAFALWNKAGGKIVQGLVARRAREATLYLKRVAPGGLIQSTGAGKSPDADPVRPLTRSPTAQSGALSAATGALALASQASPQVKQVAANLAINPVIVVAIVALVAGAVVLYRRWKQRREGVA